MVTTTVWLSVPNLSMVSSRGNVQFSVCPPSNEQVILAMVLLAPQLIVSLPGTASLKHSTPSTVDRSGSYKVVKKKVDIHIPGGTEMSLKQGEEMM